MTIQCNVHALPTPHIFKNNLGYTLFCSSRSVWHFDEGIQHICLFKTMTLQVCSPSNVKLAKRIVPNWHAQSTIHKNKENDILLRSTLVGVESAVVRNQSFVMDHIRSTNLRRKSMNLKYCEKIYNGIYIFLTWRKRRISN